MIPLSHTAEYRREYIARKKASDPVWRKQRNDATKAWQKENPIPSGITKLKYHLRKTYGLSYEQYHELLKKQAGECAVCGKQPKRLDVDHCHSTGKVRGLVCSHCNTLLHALDNPSWLDKAKIYKHKAGR